MTYPVRYMVITKTPPEDDPEGGNLADNFFPARGPDGPNFERTLGQMVHVVMPVFETGEILIVQGEYEREYGPHGRKPTKWYVEYEMFDDVQDAIRRSIEIMS